MKARAGFTLVELLIAAVLGTTVLTLAIQQVLGYFHLQQNLMVRAQLRTQIKIAQQQIFAKLRYATHFVQQPHDEGFFATIPIDANGNGELDPDDQMEVVWWRCKPDPLDPTRSPLIEQVIKTPAFVPPQDPTLMASLFDTVPGSGRQVVPRFDTLSVQQVGANLLDITLSASQVLPYQQQRVTLTVAEKVALRSAPDESGLPDLNDLLKLLKAGS